MIKRLIVFTSIVIHFTNLYSQEGYKIDTSRVVSHIIDLNKDQLDFYWKDDSGNIFGSLGRLRSDLIQDGKELVFAMNGGMYNADQSAQGIYIENGEVISHLDRKEKGYGNFYLQPNGVFYINENAQAFVTETKNFHYESDIKYATQSGPMLVINGGIHPVFKKNSKHFNIRNGVGILPDGKILFAISKAEITLFDFATYFKQMGCENALYLDGFVSKMYLPSLNRNDLGGGFGVIIGQIKN